MEHAPDFSTSAAIRKQCCSENENRKRKRVNQKMKYNQTILKRN
jgi:hypothetical protein